MTNKPESIDEDAKKDELLKDAMVHEGLQPLAGFPGEPRESGTNTIKLILQ